MSNAFDDIVDFIKMFFNNNEDSGSKTCGIPQLDILFLPVSDTNRSAHIVILKKKSPQIEKFINAYKKEASKYGKIFNNTFASYPTSAEEDKVYQAFEDIHLLRKDEYALGIAGWLPELPLESTSLIAEQAHPMLFDASYLLAQESGNDTSSVDITPTHVVIAAWMKKCMELFLNIPKLFKTKQIQKVYYKGGMKKLSIFLFFFLTRIGCNVLIEPDSNTNIDNILANLPEYIKVDVIE